MTTRMMTALTVATYAYNEGYIQWYAK